MKIFYNEPPSRNENALRRPQLKDSKVYRPGEPVAGGSSAGENLSLDMIHERIRSKQIQIGREQTTRDGLGKLAEWLGAGEEPKGRAFLDELVHKVRFRGEEVLSPLRDRLASIIDAKDQQALKSLMSEVDDRLARSLGDLDRDIVASQNMAAAGHGTEEERLDELMTSVIQGLSDQRTGSRPINKERAIDLLG